MSAALAKAPAGVAAVNAKAAVYKAAGAAGSHPVYPRTNINAAGRKWAERFMDQTSINNVACIFQIHFLTYVNK